MRLQSSNFRRKLRVICVAVLAEQIRLWAVCGKMTFRAAASVGSTPVHLEDLAARHEQALEICAQPTNLKRYKVAGRNSATDWVIFQWLCVTSFERWLIPLCVDSYLSELATCVNLIHHDFSFHALYLSVLVPQDKLCVRTCVCVCVRTCVHVWVPCVRGCVCA